MLQKILLFVIIPLILTKYLKCKVWSFWKIQKSSFIYGISFWLLWAFVIWITYFLLNEYIDWEAIKESISNRWVNQTTFIFIFVYIMFWNSLVEEFFFRWVIFNNLINYSKKIAYFLSSILFALYHITIFWTWFEGSILLLALFWLFLWAMFFAWLFEKTKWIWWAWIFHIIADLVILIIWYIEIFL
jgi:membrane protease YdiL (CAAX protease family)